LGRISPAKKSLNKARKIWRRCEKQIFEAAVEVG
jgi:hypothetical protein